MFTFSNEKDLISQNKLGFKPGDCCINQLLSIAHKICKSFDDGWEVSKAFEIKT